MICPKCGHENSQDVSCTQCGIIFEKYVQFEQRQREFEQAQWEREDRRKKLILVSGGGILAAALLVGLFLRSPSEPAPEPSPAQAQYQRPAGYAPWERGNTPGYWEQDGTQLRWVPTPGQTVLTELGGKFITLGSRHKSGILISDDCHVLYSGELPRNTSSREVANKRNLQLDYELVQEDLDNAKQTFEEKRIDFVNSCKVCDEETFRRALYKQISRVEKLEAKLIRAREKLDASEERLASDRQLRVSVNNTSALARVIQVSQKYPLTLLLVDKGACDGLKIGDADTLKEGDPVFAFAGFGKDRLMGGKYTGRSRRPEPEDYLLHDIELSKGDQGTPLFDREGRVIGITATPFDGKPRAIPIDLALRDLDLLL
ncbi:MAG: trypsin-like peptidase domain-containing protein [Candidatus Thiodiazotropha sp.]